jgi:holo-[acyl-carrier protein] synthase
MEIVGIGTDIVECARIAKMIEEHGDTFFARVFTPREVAYCRAKKNGTENFAGRWAAKEAILKCLGTGWRKGICWTDMEIFNEPDGAPRLYLAGEAGAQADRLNISDIHITISHCREYATAYALAVSGTTPRSLVRAT